MKETIRILIMGIALLSLFACKKKITEQDAQSSLPKEVAEVQDEACSMKPDPGLCKAKLSRYFYNSKTNQCEEFFWGGCGGVVPFETLKECEPCVCKN